MPPLRTRLGWFYPGVELAAFGVALAAVLTDSGQSLARLSTRLVASRPGLGRPAQLAIARRADSAADRRRSRRRGAFDPDQLSDRCLGAALGYLSLQRSRHSTERLRGREGLGGGDAKLLAASGAWLGAAALPQVILVAALIGARRCRVSAAGRHPAGHPVGTALRPVSRACHLGTMAARPSRLIAKANPPTVPPIEVERAKDNADCRSPGHDPVPQAVSRIGSDVPRLR